MPILEKNYLLLLKETLERQGLSADEVKRRVKLVRKERHTFGMSEKRVKPFKPFKQNVFDEIRQKNSLARK